MASPNSTFTELVSTTFRKHKPEIFDNVSNRNALLKRIMKKGNYEREDGGLTIVCPLDYAENSTYQRYSDWDVLDISASDVISAAEYQWRQIAINVVSSGRELRINSGESRIVKLAKGKMKNALRTFNNNFSEDIYSDGTATNQINGLQALVADLGTGTVGGIDSSTYTFWQNQIFDLSDESVTISASTIENSAMLPLWLDLDRGPDDCPDLIVADNTYYQYFEASQVSIKRYMDATTADGGLVSLKYKNADVMFDGNSGIPAAHMYFLNTQYIGLTAHRDADLEIMDEQRPINQDGVVVPILWMGNMICSNRNQQGVIVA
ncbi:MAG: phage major capsid protein [Gammaproteobacteria bacterium]|nr:phage major capsid protein [Gammaproteobacteria bacterium]